MSEEYWQGKCGTLRRLLSEAEAKLKEREKGFQEYVDDMERRLVKRVEEINTKDQLIKDISYRLSSSEKESSDHIDRLNNRIALLDNERTELSSRLDRHVNWIAEHYQLPRQEWPDLKCRGCGHEFVVEELFDRHVIEECAAGVEKPRRNCEHEWVAPSALGINAYCRKCLQPAPNAQVRLSE